MLKLYFNNSVLETEFATDSDKPYFTFIVRHLNNVFYMVVNSTIDDINNGDVLVYYDGLGDGTYLAEVYAQPIKISTNAVDINTFNITSFKRRYALELIATQSLQRGQCTRSEDSKGFSDDSYCRCVVKVGAKGGVDNPYAVCTSSVGRNRKDCWTTYNFNTMSANELRYYAFKHGISVTDRTDCELANILNDWQQQKLDNE